MKSRFGSIARFAVMLCVATSVAAYAQTYSTIHLFHGGEGRGPDSPLIQGTDGNFYGVTIAGGPSFTGTVFELSPTGESIALHQFCLTQGCPDGSGPVGALVQASNGNFYGTTYNGGTGVHCPANAGGCGTIFEITSKGQFTTIYNFCSQANCTDGAYPEGTLVQGVNGSLYGTTVGYNGSPTCIGESRTGCGTIFEITPAGKLTTLYEFCSQTNCADGYGPFSGLTLGNDGNLYGTTVYGGANLGGVAFKLTPPGLLTILHNFCEQTNCADGAQPTRPLIQAPDGNLYGVTFDGGSANCNGGCGTIFEMSTTGQFANRYSFCPVVGCADGAWPNGIALGSDGNFYGTTEVGGAMNYGTIFETTPGAQFTSGYSFCSSAHCSDGAIPFATVFQATNGIFYGTTNIGGLAAPPQGPGVAFSWDMGLSPFVAAQVNFGKVGQVVTILGNNLTGTTNVTFNGVPALFKVGSASYIKAQVPSGATTGKIQVTTSTGTLSSNGAFQVLP